MSDPRRVVCGNINAKAMHLLVEAKAGRQFGSQATTKIIKNTVVQVVQVVQEMTHRHNKQRFVVGEYTLLGGRKKIVKLYIRSVRKGWVDQNTAPAHIIVPNQQTEPSLSLSLSLC